METEVYEELSPTQTVICVTSSVKLVLKTELIP